MMIKVVYIPIIINDWEENSTSNRSTLKTETSGKASFQTQDQSCLTSCQNRYAIWPIVQIIASKKIRSISAKCPRQATAACLFTFQERGLEQPCGDGQALDPTGWVMCWALEQFQVTSSKYRQFVLLWHASSYFDSLNKRTYSGLWALLRIKTKQNQVQSTYTNPFYLQIIFMTIMYNK